MKSNKLTLIGIVILFITTTALAQVGVGTTSPDASSALDISSTTQGLLAPRMTTTERTAIVSPAKGLLVFDIDNDAFYFYDGANWIAVAGGVKRNNYKLVQSDVDLADELAAGGGSSYLLDENTLYEINGTIFLAASIDINGAYVFGADGNEDVLVRAGGVIFSGVKGGGIKGVTLTAPGGSVFNMTGDGTENIIWRDCAVVNSGSVGTINNYNIVFLDVIQFVGNTTGVIYTDIKQLLLNTTAWDGNNEGIYETYVGDFDIISKQGGYCKVVTATAAIDVTGVTSVSGSAGLNVVDFFGGGNYINGSSPYAGYNFTNDWKVNSPGIAVETDEVAAGNFYYDGPLTTGFTQTISSGAAVEIQGDGTFTTSNLFRFTSAGGGNRLVYDGTEEHSFQINASLSIRVDSAVGNFYAFLIAKNGTVVTESNSIAYIASDVQIQNISINTNLNLISGDYIEVFAERLTGSGNDTLVVFSENLTIK